MVQSTSTQAALLAKWLSEEKGRDGADQRAQGLAGRLCAERDGRRRFPEA